MPCVPMPISPNLTVAMLFSLAETLALSTRCPHRCQSRADTWSARNKGAGTMATIHTHQAKDGTKTYGVCVRRQGELTQTATFPSLRDARIWATMVEGDIIAGRHFPTRKPKHTLSASLERYVQEIMPRKTL